MYTLNCNPADPLIGLPGLISSLARTPSSPTNNLAGFSTTGVPGFAPPDAGTFTTYRRHLGSSHRGPCDEDGDGSHRG